MTQSEAAILIVSYNSAADIVACLESTKQTGHPVLVIDNASDDNTPELVANLDFPVIANASNRGFAAAVNQGVRATTAPFLLLLNPDAVLQTDVTAMFRQCMTAGAGAVGGQLLTADGVMQKGFTVRRFPTPWDFIFEALLVNRLWRRNPVNWRYRCLDLDLSKPARVEQPAGAFLLFRRAAWERVGGFDEGFFPIWFEDVDFCKRIADAGFDIFYSPASVAVHRGAHSISQLGLGTRTEYWYRSLLRYSVVHFHPGGRILTGLGVAIGSLLRLLLAGLDQWNAQLFRSYGEVVKLAIRSMWTRELKSGERFA